MKVKMELFGISDSVTQVDSYVVLLMESENNDPRTLPIIIGSFEAQSIALGLEGTIMPRPLTHDLFVSIFDELRVNMNEILIYKMESGIFYSKLIIENENETIGIECRTSDALAIAIRFGAPIFVESEVLESVGVTVSEAEGKSTAVVKKGDMSIYSIVELNEQLNDAIESEDYEQASKIRDEITKRQ
jgi:bifunctional DNase/RNase